MYGRWTKDSGISRAEWNKRKREWHEIDRIHNVWHSFQRRFCKDGPSGNDDWKYRGYDLMKRVKTWAKKYPDDVTITGCDDAVFAGSDLVLIEHRSDKLYMGTSVVYIPQCTSENPIQFFLYPGHRFALIAALRRLGRIKGRKRPVRS